MPYNRLGKNFDIREYKKKLRAKYRKLRSEISPNHRKILDEKIHKNLFSTTEYAKCSLVLCFVSMDEEIDTHGFINKCVSNGKKVAVPYCIENSREMDFYYINDLSDLTPRTFGVLEPDPQKHEKVKDFSDSICVLPGLSFDRFGYRLGYGGGYYDRFLSSKFNGFAKIGICYRKCLRNKLVHGRFDMPCDYIVSEKDARKCKIPNT